MFVLLRMKLQPCRHTNSDVPSVKRAMRHIYIYTVLKFRMLEVRENEIVLRTLEETLNRAFAT